MKRYRVKPLKRDTLTAYYGKSEDGEIDVCFANGPGCERADARLLYSVLATQRCRPDISMFDGTYLSAVKWEHSFLDELESRGYDLTTLKFSIRKKGHQNVQANAVPGDG